MTATANIAQLERLAKSRAQTVDLGNNEKATCGLVKIADGFFALTLSDSKQFANRATAVRWLAKRGVFVS